MNANHLRPVRSGWVHAETRRLRVGRRIQVWEVDIRDEHGHRVCSSRLTLAVVSKDRPPA